MGSFVSWGFGDVKKNFECSPFTITKYAVWCTPKTFRYDKKNREHFSGAAEIRAYAIPKSRNSNYVTASPLSPFAISEKSKSLEIPRITFPPI